MESTITKVDTVFEAFKQKGWGISKGEEDCNSCASAVLEGYSNYVFYTSQAVEDFKEEGGLIINFYIWNQQEANDFVEALEAAGLKVDWDGTWQQNIKVS